MDSVLIVLHSEANTDPLIQLLNKWGLGIKASCFFVDRLGGGESSDRLPIYAYFIWDLENAIIGRRSQSEGIISGVLSRLSAVGSHGWGRGEYEAGREEFVITRPGRKSSDQIDNLLPPSSIFLIVRNPLLVL